MCGIAGVISRAGRFTPDEHTLRRMSARIAHRGPDGEGRLAVRTATGDARLLHRRLAVLDLGLRSNQPFSATYAGRTAHLVFNGEIYNFRELRRTLEPLLPGFHWHTTGDTEVLLAAYLAWGVDCVRHLLGMFAFAVVDETAGSLLLARDRMGQKPLYYAPSPDHDALAFASELPALTPLTWVDATLDEDALRHYLAFGYTPLSGSICRGIRKLPPGHTLTWPPPAKPQTYWTPESCPPADPQPDTRALIQQAVASQLVSDVPLGCFLSGGIDSSIVALCAQSALRGSGQRLRTFTVAFDDPRYDESPFAAEVARHLGTDHTPLQVPPPDPADLQTLAEAYGEPFADSSALPTLALCREARKHVTVALAGDGGDELFGGYDRYRAMTAAARLGPLARLPGVAAAGRRLGRGHPKSRLARIGRFLASAGMPPGHRYEAWVRLFPPGTWDAPPLTGTIAGVTFPDHLPPALAAMAVDRPTYLDGDLLTKVDRASMHFALEVRAPFMDHRVVEAAVRLPAEVLFPPDGRTPKAVLHAAFGHELPPAVFTRTKQGFSVPIGEWFRGPLRTALQDTLLSPNGFCRSRWGDTAVAALIRQHLTGAHDHTQRLFAALMLDLWAQGTAR